MRPAQYAPMPNAAMATPYPAALTISGAAWRSPLARGERVALARPAIQIGRLEGNDIVLEDPLASRHHAVVRWANGGYELEDLGSANGTFVQGQRVTNRMLLTPGQTLRIGNTDMRFDLLAPQDANASLAQPAPLPAYPLTGASAAATYVGPLAPPAGALAPQGAHGAMPPLPPAAATMAQAGVAAPHHFYEMLAQPRENGFVRTIRTEWRKRYWRIFLLGALAYALVAQVLSVTSNLHLVPLALLLASALVPVVFVIFCWEQNALADMPLSVVGITFLSGAVVGLTIAAVLEPLLLPQSLTHGITLSAALLIGICEETAKVVCVLWFLRERRLRSELDGLILGAAAGMGFAALETAGYGFVAFLGGFVNTLASANSSTLLAIHTGFSQMNYQLLLRMALAIFGHGVWTAIVCAAIWRERGQSAFRLTSGVLTALAIAVGLHALWDWSPVVSLLPDTTAPLVALVVILGWFLFVGGLGIFFLRFFLRESLYRAKLGPLAPAPAPLIGAILRDTFQPSRSAPQMPSIPAPPYAPAPYVAAAYLPPTPLGYPPNPMPTQAPAPAAYCPRCGLGYPPGTPTCARCGGPLTQPR